MKGEAMSKVSNPNPNSEIVDDWEMEPEYDFSKGVRGKHYLPNLSDGQQPVVVKVKSKDEEKYVTMRIVETQAIITADGQLIAQLPSDIIPGEHRVILRIEQPAS
jgi:hypothetical protein